MRVASLAVIFVTLFSTRGFAAEKYLLGDAPFISQSPPGDWAYNMNCGPTTALILAGYYTQTKPQSTDIKKMLDWLYQEKYIFPQTVEGAEYYDGNATSAGTIASILAKYLKLGSVIKKNANDWDYLKKELDKGNPVIVGVNIKLNASAKGHFMVLVGLKDYDDEAIEDEVILHDPGRTEGAFKLYPRSQFESSWATSGYVSLVVRSAGATWFPNGSLIQVHGDSKVYVVIDGKLYWINDETVFNALNFDWQKIIFAKKKALDCLEVAGTIDWVPYRELFSVGSDIYLMEKNSFDATTCATYRFSSIASYNSWNIPGQIAALSGAQAQAKYFSACATGGVLYLKSGTLVKPNFTPPGFGPGVVFLATDGGILQAFDSWRSFYLFDYENSPLMLVAESLFEESFASFGESLTVAESQQCLKNPLGISGGPEEDSDQDGYTVVSGDCDDSNSEINPGAQELCDGMDNDCNGVTDGFFGDECNLLCGKGQRYCDAGKWTWCKLVEPNVEIDDGIDNDCDGLIDEGFDIPEDTDPKDADIDKDGYSVNQGDCDDWEPTVNPGHKETCDLLDNDCDFEIDEGADCGQGKVCVAGVCVATTEPVADKLSCTVSCQADMKAYVWFGVNGVVSGNPAVAVFSEETLCERGAAWIDFNCACLKPQEWACFDWQKATVKCSAPVEVKKGTIDYVGEGEAWFTGIDCSK